MFCANCGENLLEGTVFCPKCGTKAPESGQNALVPQVICCSHCGTELGEGVAFCPHCGTPAGAGASAQAGFAGFEIKQEKAINYIQAQPAVFPGAGAYAHQNALMADEKYCFACGSPIKKAAEICPKCGINQNTRNATLAIDVYCMSCGKTMKKEVTVCPFCGVKQSGGTKKKLPALLLCLFLAGGHRLYTGKIVSGILMLLLYLFAAVFGSLAGDLDEDSLLIGGVIALGFAIWWVIDLVNICTGKFKDKQGYLLLKN